MLTKVEEEAELTTQLLNPNLAAEVLKPTVSCNYGEL
jgi:hypothetical protein